MRMILASMAIAIILLTVDVIGEKPLSIPLTTPSPPLAEEQMAGFSSHKKTDRLPLYKPKVRKPAQGQVIILPPLR